MAVRKPFFVKPLPLEAMVCSSAETGHPVSNLARFDAIGLTWKAAEHGSHWVRGSFDTAQPIDFVSVVSANATADTLFRLRLGDTQGEVEVEGAAPYDSGLMDFISPAIERDDGLYHSHFELPSVVTRKWWRIDVMNQLTPFEASMLVMGEKLEPSRFYDFDFELGIEDLGEGRFTPWGVFDETPGLVFRTREFSLAWQTEAEMYGGFLPLMETLGKRGIVFVAFDPEPTVYRQAKTYMGVLTKPGYARGVRKAGTFSQDFAILSMI